MKTPLWQRILWAVLLPPVMLVCGILFNAFAVVRGEKNGTV